MGNIKHITIGEIVEVVATFSIDKSFLGQKGVVTRVDADRNVVRVQGPFLGGAGATPWDIELKADEWNHAPENQEDPKPDLLLGDVSPEEAAEAIGRLRDRVFQLEAEVLAAQGRANEVEARLHRYDRAGEKGAAERLSAERCTSIALDHSESNVGEGRRLASEVLWWRHRERESACKLITDTADQLATDLTVAALRKKLETVGHQLQEVRTAREVAEARVAKLAPLERRSSQYEVDYRRTVKANVDLRLRCDYLETLHRAGGLRPAVVWFAQQMEKKLRVNDHKDGWEHLQYAELTSLLLDEVTELRTALTLPRGEDAVSEAADVANFAMMIAHNKANGR